MIVKVETDDGICGWGEAFGPAFANKAIIEHYYAPKLIGMDPFESSVIWEKLYSALQDHGQKGTVIEALSAIDLALWDIKGKKLNMPVYQLMGGAQRKYVKPYATGLYHRDTGDILSDLIEEAVGYVQAGFKGVKLKIGFDVEKDKIKIREIRRAIGGNIAFMVDANHAYNARTAINIGKFMEDYSVLWFEEPVPPEDIEGYVEVKSKIDIPIAGGEAEFTRYGYQNLLEKRAVDILQMDCCAMGGLSEYQKILVLASLKNIQCFPHVWGSSIAVNTALQAAFSQPNFPNALYPEEIWFELDRTPNIFREELSLNKLVIKDGYISAPELPGLGFVINEDLIKNSRSLKIYAFNTNRKA